MKIRFVRVVALLAVVFVLNNCTSGLLVTNGNVPPGQAKKAAGTQSAKEFAPGQQKKAAGQQSAKEFTPSRTKKSASSVSSTSNSQLPPGQTKKK